MASTSPRLNLTTAHELDYAAQRAHYEAGDFGSRHAEMSFRRAVLMRRRREARELKLWRDARTQSDADSRDRELGALGFYDYDSDRWEQHVAVLREVKQQATPGDRAARIHSGRTGEGQGPGFEGAA